MRGLEGSLPMSKALKSNQSIHAQLDYYQTWQVAYV